MKTIGILGGMSWVSSLHYYKWLCELAQEKIGPENTPPILLNSVDWAKIKAFQRNADWDSAGKYLAEEAQKLENIGADILLIGTNTMHIVADQVQNTISIPLLHIADATAKRIKSSGIDQIGLLGTSFTMEQDFYKSRLEHKGIKVTVPEEDDRNIVNSIIFDELCQNITTPEAKKEYMRISNTLINNGAQGLILGCTEITTLIGQDDFDAPVFDTTRIHVEEAFNAALEKGHDA